MFNLDQAIEEWRRQMVVDGLTANAALDELESHLQDDVERQVQSGVVAEQAFRTAVSRLGQSVALTHEFAKIGETSEIVSRIKYFLLTLAGIQNPTLATNMNTSSPNRNPEPAWATYVKSVTFALPAALLWLFVAVFVFPKFVEVLSGSRNWMPGILRVGWDLSLFMTHYLFPIGVTCAVAVGLLEWRSANWRRYRKLALATGVFLLNSAVLIAITAMVVLSLVVASDLARHAAK
jgi:hypothetical protein